MSRGPTFENLQVRIKFRLPAIFFGWHQGVESRVFTKDEGIFFPGVIASYHPFPSSRGAEGGG